MAQADRKLRMFWEELDHEGRTGDFQGDSRGMNDVSRVGPGGLWGEGITGGRGRVAGLRKDSWGRSFSRVGLGG